MKKLIYSAAFFVLSLSYIHAQTVQFTIEIDGDQICVQIVPEFTDPSACINGGDVVVFSPPGVIIGTVTDVTAGPWVDVVGPLEYPFAPDPPVVTLYQFHSEGRQTIDAVEGQPIDLFCFTIPPECTEGEIRLLEQIDPVTGSGNNPDQEIFDLGATHSMGASFTPAPSCEPSNNAYNGNVEPIVIYDCGLVAPVEFIAFTARKYGDAKSILNWSTATETNNDFFSVERSRTGQSFEPISEVKGAGNSTKPLFYEFIDETPYQGRNYYRIVQYDYDGKNVATPIREVRFDGDQNGRSLEVFPNPSSSGLYIRFTAEQPEAESVVAVLYDNLGRTVYSSDLNAETIQEYIDYKQSNISSGAYILQIRSGEQIIAQEKVIVQRPR